MIRKGHRQILSFVIAFILAYLAVGYIRNTMFVAIDWVEGATVWNKLREYYMRTYALNIVPSLIIALVATILVSVANRKQ